MNVSELTAAINDKIVKTSVVIVCHPDMIHALEKDDTIPYSFLLVSNPNQDVDKAYRIDDEGLKRWYLMQAGRLLI